MPIDRAATLRQAEKLLRQGKVDQAIAEYVRLVEDQPADWNTANVLGDLYVRANHLDRAIDQYSRVAETIAAQGFLSRASAVYKKILKLKPDADHALVRGGELAAEQGLLADARSLFAAAAQGRRSRGDVKGALEIVVRVGSLDRRDVESRMAAARARLELDDLPGALQEFNDLAAMLVEEGRDADALVPLSEIASRDPANVQVARELSRILVAQGRSDEAAKYLTPDVLRTDAGLSLVTEQPDAAYAIVSKLVDADTAAGKWTEAADLLTRFVTRLPHHIPALAQLVEVCVDGGLEERTVEAQAQLADAYLATGAASEAKYVAEDLLTRQPSEPSHIARLRSALVLAGISNPDQAVADWLAERQPTTVDSDPAAEMQASAVESVVEQEPVAIEPVVIQETKPDPPAQPVPPKAAGDAANPHSIDLDLIFGKPGGAVVPPASVPPAPPSPVRSANVEEDLSVALDQFQPAPPVAPEPVPAQPAAPPPDIESVFAQFRNEAEQQPRDDQADVAYTRGLALFEAGDLNGSIESLRTAARSPGRRFAAATLLGRIYQQQNAIPQAIEWLGHAVDAPATSAQERFETLFKLAELLELSGEREGALALFLELQVDAGEFKDVTRRISRLSRREGGG